MGKSTVRVSAGNTIKPYQLGSIVLEGSSIHVVFRSYRHGACSVVEYRHVESMHVAEIMIEQLAEKELFYV